VWSAVEKRHRLDDATERDGDAIKTKVVSRLHAWVILPLSLSPFFPYILSQRSRSQVVLGVSLFFFSFFLFFGLKEKRTNTHTYSRNVYKVEGGKRKKKKRTKVLLLLGFFYYSVQTGVIKKR
jgi:hypothetical protein